LKFAASVLLPLTIAILLAFVLEPVVRFLGKYHIPRIASILLSSALIVIGLYSMGLALFSSGRTILSSYPRYEDRLTEIYVGIASFFELSYDEHLSFLENLWNQLGIRTRVRVITLSLSNEFLIFLKDAFMVVLFVFFLLTEASFFKDKVFLAFENKRSGQIYKISHDVVHEVTRYLSIKFLISLVTGAVVAGLLKLAGLEFPLVWGMIQFILNFIPSIGSIAVGVAAGVFALLQFWPFPQPVITVALIMLGTNMIIGNVMEPKIMGDNLGLSPIAVLVSLVVWGWIWGFAGMILAVPMTVIIRIICENISSLEPVSILLASHRSLAAKKNAREKEQEPETPSE
ncbi:MAG: AI-2E family transporter, partial [Spirochaetaceae bacterium]|nr:AI-2E family transporter [Spirochaetaceae bacterium]